MDIVLNQNSDEPIYSQIFQQISNQILSGKILSGTQLPTIRLIAQELKISVIPVKRAWEELDRCGLIKTITGKGTFVSELNQTKLKEIKSSNAENFVKQFCIQAKENGISQSELIKLIKALY